MGVRVRWERSRGRRLLDVMQRRRGRLERKSRRKEILPIAQGVVGRVRRGSRTGVAAGSVEAGVGVGAVVFVLSHLFSGGCGGGVLLAVGLVQLAHVLLQVEVAAKSLVTIRAGEGLPLVVRVHVEGQVVDLVEGLAAHITFVSLLARVRQAVVLVVALLVEALAAKLADPRLVALMDAHVRVQRGAAVEGLAANLTLVRLLVRVDDFVAAEGGRLAETLSTNFANERTSS